MTGMRTIRVWIRYISMAVAVAMVSAAVFVWTPYQREQRIERMIRSRMSEEHLLHYTTPAYIPQVICDYVPMFRRISEFGLSNTYDDFRDLLPELKELSELRALGLGNTQVDDAGLEHLGKCKNLRIVELDDTMTTPAGREKLRKALPRCRVTPDP